MRLLPGPKTSKLLAVFLAIIFLVFVTATIFTSFHRKNKLKDLAKDQSVLLFSLKEDYKDIVDVYRGVGLDINRRGMLGVSINLDLKEITPKMIGLENEPEIARARKVNELYKKSKLTVDEIDENNKSVNKIIKNPIIQALLGEKPPIEQTSKFVVNTNQIITFLEKELDLQIRAIKVSFELGLALQLSVQNGDETSLKKLEEKLSDLKALVKEEQAIDIKFVPQDLRTRFENDKKEAEQFIASFENMIYALRNKDLESAQLTLENLISESQMKSEVEDVETMNFWQNNQTIRSTEKLRFDWDKFYKSI